MEQEPEFNDSVQEIDLQRLEGQLELFTEPGWIDRIKQIIKGGSL